MSGEVAETPTGGATARVRVVLPSVAVCGASTPNVVVTLRLLPEDAKVTPPPALGKTDGITYGCGETLTETLVPQRPSTNELNPFARPTMIGEPAGPYGCERL